MRAVCWNGVNEVRVETVPDPEILNPRDVIVRVTTAAICGSDLHLYDGYIPAMKKGDILGHEFMGEVVELGTDVKNVQVGDRVVVPFNISCGQCFFCQKEMFSLCDNTNPNSVMAEKMFGYSPAGLYGYSHLTGGYAGGQADYVRVPFADVNVLKVPEGMEDEKALFLGDIFPTGYMAAENCDIEPGDTVAVWGCGPVGQFAIQSAWMLGAERVIAIDRFPERLLLAEGWGRAEILDYEQVDSVLDTLRDMTGGFGPDCCIDAVGMEAHGSGLDGFYDKAKQSLRLESDRPTVLRDVIMACRKGGTVSIPGVYGGFGDKIPIGAMMNKGLTIKTGQTHVQRYMRPLLDRIQAGEIDPSRIISHSLDLEDAPEGYETFKHKEDNCIKVILKPHAHGNGHSHHHGGNGNGRHRHGMEGERDHTGKGL
ncbi:MAG TPA: zinc-dependent alcohol dehydrogenase [Thermoanaerobaculia bacterium]|nr:zinc-dependent alcohol dehydrogenase [Thermoanaerobaculia bacterium]